MIIIDQRPSSELEDIEVMAYVFQAMRAKQMKTARQVQRECARMFPDMPIDRQRDCLAQLAAKLS
jgi:hypothetical protein